jgi:hypothetical protein
VEDFVAAAGRRFDLAPQELARLVESVGRVRETRRPASGSPGRIMVTKVECNDQQAIDLAGQIEARWGAVAMPWNLSRRGEPPAGMIVGTRFHQAEMLSRWPHRERDMCFAALRVDPAVVQRIRNAPGGGGLVLVERDIGTAHQHAADLTEVLPEAADAVVTTDVPDAERLRRSDKLYVIAPRLWDLLDEDVRADERVVLIRHVFDEADAQALGKQIEQYAFAARCET